MLLSHVLPLRPEPKIQMMFSGLTPDSRAFFLPLLVRHAAVSSEISRKPFLSQR